MADSGGDEPSERNSETIQERLFYPDADQRSGGKNVQLFGGLFDVHPVVFPVSVCLIVLFVLITLLFQPLARVIGLRAADGTLLTAAGAFGAIQRFGTTRFDWLLTLGTTGTLLTALALAVSKYGRIRIGGAHAEKEFSDFSWIAMLFSAGMGIGLIFYGVSEPMYGLQTLPPFFDGIEPKTPEAGKAALVQTLFHWALAPWGVYALVGLGIAFFAFNRGLPLSLRSAFWPLLGDRIYGWPGHVINITAVFATLFGLTTTLGLGVQQVNAGLSILSPQLVGVAIPQTRLVEVSLIAAITLVATGSVAAGLDEGVKRLSSANTVLMGAMLVLMLIVGPTSYLLGTFSSAMGMYLAVLPEMSLFTGTTLGADASAWLSNWTFFYWAWWIAWSPFVGIFIARISKGRTVREFVAGVLVIPSLFGALWFSAFGGAAIYAQFNGGEILRVLNEQGQTATIYAMLGEYPLGLLISIIATVLVAGMFVTSSDSGSLVIDHLTAGGKHDVPRAQRVFWALTEGVVAAVLLLSGGLTALQAASIAIGVPFAAILLLMCYAVYRGLKREHAIINSAAFAEQLEETTAQSYGDIVRNNRDRDPVPGDD
ncbi:glycine/betaine ABC transporter [Haloprofundus marisrubri]|uniref:Glycine/betaine ABC transporter n=1 Tax=Haloprofundus marisrubri TaxID=1514971 RepID=A0A0W1R3J0_9EURY|nr:BCCT family transporter [Haloprofundus marisrubri]KTG07694.1 glycine/betaine ABC transporter [Haloprofundus marisrubri]